MKSSLAIGLVFLASICMAQETETHTVAKADVEPELREELKAFEPFLGTWVIDTKWQDGRPFWAKNVYTVGMDGNFVITKTYTRQAEGKPYESYLTIWRWDKDQKKVVSHGFANDGTYQATNAETEMGDDGKPTIITVTATKGSPVAIQHTVKLIDEGSYSWKVATSATKPAVIMDGVWKKQE